MSFFCAHFCDNILDVAKAVDKIAAIFSEHLEGLEKDEREKRIRALEKVATSVRTRRARREEPRSTLVTSPKARLHA